MKKLLFCLNPENSTNRVVRRAVVVAVLTFVSVLITQLLNLAPEWAVPIMTGLLAGLDKLKRELKELKV